MGALKQNNFDNWSFLEKRIGKEYDTWERRRFDDINCDTWEGIQNEFPFWPYSNGGSIVKNASFDVQDNLKEIFEGGNSQWELLESIPAYHKTLLIENGPVLSYQVNEKLWNKNAIRIWFSIEGYDPSFFIITFNNECTEIEEIDAEQTLKYFEIADAYRTLHRYIYENLDEINIWLKRFNAQVELTWKLELDIRVLKNTIGYRKNRSNWSTSNAKTDYWLDPTKGLTFSIINKNIWENNGFVEFMLDTANTKHKVSYGCVKRIWWQSGVEYSFEKIKIFAWNDISKGWIESKEENSKFIALIKQEACIAFHNSYLSQFS